MKKKLLLVTVMVALLLCALAVSVCAATEVIDGISYDLSNGIAKLSKNANQSVDKEVIIIPEQVTDSNGKVYTVTEINDSSFRGNKNIKYVSLPPTITRISSAAFHSCSNLVFVDFNDNQNNVWMQGWGTFRECTSLKAICLPDNMTFIGDQCFTNCKSMTAVHLPNNIEIIKGNQGAGPAFGGSNANNKCNSLFFTPETFEVRDENGNFYTAETFKVPEKPEVYYFPSTLKAITGNHNPNNNPMDEAGMIKSGGSSDCGIQFCPNINSVLVLPDGYIGYSDQSSGNAILDENQRGDTLNSGLLPGCSSSDNPITVVFLSRIDRVSMDRKGGDTSYMTYVFANKANTGFENTKIGTWYNGNDTSYQKQNEMYVVFCNANNGAGAKYKISFKGSDDNKTYPVLVSELQEGNAHIANPNTTITTPADCIKGAAVTTYCYCGNIAASLPLEGSSALGHNTLVENGALDLGIAYVDFFALGVHTYECARCGEACAEETEALFMWKGYSVSTFGDTFSMTQGFLVNRDALKEYKKYASDFEFGLIIAGNKSEDGAAFAPELSGDLCVPQSHIAHNYFDIKITGITSDFTDKLVVFCAFVKNGEKVYYLDNHTTSEAVTGISYNAILALLG